MPAPLWWKGICRLSQSILYLGSFLLPWWRPYLIKGKGSAGRLPEFLRGKRLSHGMLVTDGTLFNLGLPNNLVADLKKSGIQVTVYSEVTPNPTVDQIESALQIYVKSQCDHLIGFGGGSAIDCAKAIGARVARPRTSIRRMRGILRVLWPTPTVVAVPTTAGTGSECTLAAVVSSPQTHEKYALEDPFLVPSCAVLDPTLTVGQPSFVTAATGMDALTHGIEAYLNIFQVRQTETDAKMTVCLVFNNLLQAYKNPTNIVYRENMQEAAYLGGCAFTRAYVGYVHAIAHALSAWYDVPHGYANAVVLPYVLEMYDSVVHRRLAQLAEVIGIWEGTDAQKAQRFIQSIRDLNASLNLPTTIPGTDHKYRIREEDIPELVAHVLAEANPLYPVPVIFGKEEITSLIRMVM